MKRPKEKGSSFERYIAKELTQWTGIEFTRTPQSGAGKVKGDVFTARDSSWPFVMECKAVESLKIDDLFRRKGKLYNIFKKVESECIDGQLPMLFWKVNNQPTLVISYLDSMQLITGVNPTNLNPQFFRTCMFLPYKVDFKKKSITKTLMIVEFGELVEKFPFKRNF